MTIEEINKWLDNEYGVSYTRLEELHDFYFEKYCDLQQENKKQKEVIDKAIEYINNNWDGCSYTDETLKNKVSELNITELLDILKEVE